MKIYSWCRQRKLLWRQIAQQLSFMEVDDTPPPHITPPPPVLHILLLLVFAKHGTQDVSTFNTYLEFPIPHQPNIGNRSVQSSH